MCARCELDRLVEGLLSDFQAEGKSHELTIRGFRFALDFPSLAEVLCGASTFITNLPLVVQWQADLAAVEWLRECYSLALPLLLFTPQEAAPIERSVMVEVFPFIITPMGVWQVAEDADYQPLLCPVIDAHPTRLAGRLVSNHLGLTPTLLHSTSWRYEDDHLILSFAAVLPRGESVVHLHARSFCAGATMTPEAITAVQVRDHALRHMAFLAQTDLATMQVLSPITSVLAWEPDIARFFLHKQKAA